MIKQVLVIGYDRKTKRKMKWECPRYAECCHFLPAASDAMRKLAGENTYLLIVFFMRETNDILTVKNIRDLTDIPILVLVEEYKGRDKIDILEAGADEYISYPETIWEAIASCRALIRRYTMLNRQRERPMNLTIQGEVFIHGDCRKVFISGKELRLTSREYDLFRIIEFRQSSDSFLFYNILNDNERGENKKIICIFVISSKFRGNYIYACRMETKKHNL